jgi:hypothetical protein
LEGSGRGLFGVQCQHLPGKNGENYRKQVGPSGIELGISQIQM